MSEVHELGAVLKNRKQPLTTNDFGGKKGCVNLLIQAGLDVWTTNWCGQSPNPGMSALEPYQTWWYELLAKETLQAKSSLASAANAISVTVALVATTSFGGPL